LGCLAVDEIAVFLSVVEFVTVPTVVEEKFFLPRMAMN
jgi:hypothetical protein